MALVPIISQTWDTTSIFNPTRMNNIENNLAIVSDATGVKYSNGVSVKDKIDSNYEILNAKIQRKEFLQKQNLTFDNIPSTCTGLLLLRGFTSSASGFWFLIPINVYGGSAVIDTPLKTGSFGADPTGASYSNGTLTVTMSSATSSYFATLIYGN